MKTKLNRIFFFTFVVLWALVVVVNLAIPYRSYSENENRYLSAFPRFSLSELFNGEFMGKVEVYINEQFLARDAWINAQSLLEYGLGKKESNNVFIGKNTLIGKISGPNDKFVEENIGGINYFTSITDIPAFVMIVPSASEILTQRMPPFAKTWSQQDTIKAAYDALEEAKGISLQEVLSEHQEDYIFYRTDHHWTTYGAYLAYTQYCSENRLEPVEYTAELVSTSFNGTLYSSSGIRFIKSDEIEAFKNSFDPRCDIFDGKTTISYDSIYFSEYLEKKDKYAYFLGTNQPIVTLYGKEENGPALLVFKDSYAHSFAPMLLEHYSKITLVDLRYINRRLDNYLDIADYDDALFLLSIDTFVNQKDIAKLTYLMKDSTAE
ncbi:MAG: hypothetical protein GX303_08510 [Clostridiales bacterium]|nr:hypothetical protein [Clostridiales bacterium]